MKKFLLVTVAIVQTMSLMAQPKLTKDNVEEVLGAMTLQEKATLVVGSGWGSMIAGSLTASDASLVPGAAGTTQAIPRLGIPQVVLSDGPAGLRIDPVRKGDDATYYCTGFPVGTLLASTFDVNLVEEMTSAMGNEVLEYGADVLLAPGLNLHRNPLCGRNFEYFSEDPVLSGKIASAYVKGIQSNGVGVSVKHFMGNNQEVNRMENDSRINARALRELYLKNFEIVVKEAEPWTIMSSYNKVNGQYTQQNHDLLTTITRDEWGYKGMVMTDWGSKDGTVKAVYAGNDLMEPGMAYETERIVDAVNNGTLDIADLDRNVRNILNLIVKTPRFNGYQYSNKPDLKSHAQISRRVGAEGSVLLRNEGVLPLNPSNVALFGNNAYKTVAGGTGSGNVNKAYIRNIDEGLTAAGFTVDSKIQAFYKEYRKFVDVKTVLNSPNSNGSDSTFLSNLYDSGILPEPSIDKNAIIASVARNDAAIYVIGRNAGESDDRRLDDFEINDVERKTLKDICDVYHEAGKKVIVVMNIGGVIETASWKNMVDAILLSWTPGQEAGHVVADVLTGKVNPSGKLPMTFPVSYFDIPSSANFPYQGQQQAKVDELAALIGSEFDIPQIRNTDYTEYAEGIWVGYRYFDTADKAVSYPFGFGLSYTTFAYSKPVVKSDGKGGFFASITVTNTGKVAGKEAVELYVAAPEGGLVKPEKELKAFAKTKELMPGESQTLTMSVSVYSLASFNETASQWETAAGNYSIKFGASVEDIRATANFKISKPEKWEVHRAMLPESPVKEITVK